MAATDASLLGTFQKHIDDMRGLIHCKICLKPFYEPFTLTCGHTYCYSCLSGWLNGPHNKREDKNCPDCRQKITVEPSPNFTLRDLVHMFLNRVELLPEDETIREHEQGQEAEAKVLADDKKGPGLFKGRFKKRRPVYGLARVLRDATDGVDRCPGCHWELEDGMCNQCGWPGDSDMSEYDSDESIEDHVVDLEGYDSDDDERDISPIDQFGGPIDIPVLPAGYHQGAFSDNGSDVIIAGPRSPRYYSVDEDEHDNEMEDFIDDDDYPEEVDHDDNDSVHTVNTHNPTSPAAQYATDNGGVTTDYDEDDDEPVPRHLSDYGRRLAPIEVDAESDSGSESEATTQATNYDNDTASVAPTADDDGDDNSNDSDDSSVLEIPPPRPAIRSRKRRVVESEEEESSGDDSEESDDTAIRAPQSAEGRRARLDARRASTIFQAARRARSPSPQRLTTNWARRGSGTFRGRATNTVPRRGHPYTRGALRT